MSELATTLVDAGSIGRELGERFLPEGITDEQRDQVGEEIAHVCSCSQDGQTEIDSPFLGVRVVIVANLSETRNMVKAGADILARLDERKADQPAWHTRINLGSLDVGDERTCMLGQLYPGVADWYQALRRFFIDVLGAGLGSVYHPLNDQAARWGFSGSREQSEILNLVWIEEIERRQSAS